MALSGPVAEVLPSTIGEEHGQLGWPLGKSAYFPGGADSAGPALCPAGALWLWLPGPSRPGAFSAGRPGWLDARPGGARVQSRSGFSAWCPAWGRDSGEEEAQVGPPLFPCEPQSHKVEGHHCLEERPRDRLNLVPVPIPSPRPGARTTSLEAAWCHLVACGAPVGRVTESERDRPSPASQVGWLNRGCSGARALNPRLLPAPSACTPAQGPSEECAGRLPGVGGGASPQTPRGQRSGPCALLGGRGRAPGRLGIPGSRTCYHSRPARLRGGGNTPPPLRLPAPHGPRTWIRCPAPPPRNVCPESRSLPREPRLGRCPRVKSKAGPGRPGDGGLEARVVGRPLDDGFKWIMSLSPLPSRDLRPTSQPFPLGGGGLSLPPLKFSLQAFLTPTPPLFSVVFSALGHSGDCRVLPASPSRRGSCNASPA